MSNKITKNELHADIVQTLDSIAAHKADETSNVYYADDTGTANTKVVALNPVPTSYKKGLGISFTNLIENTGAVTINVNGLGAKSVLKSDSSTLFPSDLKANGVYTLRYNGTSFILQGESEVKINGESTIDVKAQTSLNTGDRVEVVIGGYTDKLPALPNFPATSPFLCLYSPDGKHLAVTLSNAPSTIIYKRTGDSYTYLTTLANGAMTGTSNKSSYSPDGKYLSIISTLNRMDMYRVSGDTYTLISPFNGTPPLAYGQLTFSPDMKHAVATYYKFFDYYKFENEKLVKLGSYSTGDSWNYFPAFTKTGDYLAISIDDAPNLAIYKRTGNTLIQLPPPAILPTYYGTVVVFSPDDKYLLISTNNSNRLMVYKRNGDTFTKLPALSYLPPGDVQSMKFSPDGAVLGVSLDGTNSSLHLVTYRVNSDNDSFVKLPDPAILPTYQYARGLDISPDGKHLAITSTQSSGNVYIYTNFLSARIKNTKDSLGALGYVKKGGIINQQVAVTQLWTD